MKDSYLNFPIGSQVRLTIGGPVMIVSSSNECESNRLACCWFDREGKLHSEAFDTDLLILASKDEDYQLHQELAKKKTQFDILQLDTAIEQSRATRMGISKTRGIHGKA